METDPFLTHTEPQLLSPKPEASDAKDVQRIDPGRWTRSKLLVLGVLPWLCFCSTLAVTVFVFHWHPLLVYLVMFVLAALSLVAVGLDLRNNSRIWFLIGWCSFVAIIIACVSGMMIYQISMKPYNSFTDDRTYTNVMPSELAKAHADAGRIDFANAALIDTAKSLGFEAGQKYCVAPILASSAISRVEYWAVGLNCCGNRASFHCDAAADPDAKVGLVLRDYGGLLGLFMNSPTDRYKQAVKEAKAAFDLSSDAPLFVRWVSGVGGDVNADNIIAGYYNRAVMEFVGCVFFHLFFQLLVVFTVFYISRSQPSAGATRRPAWEKPLDQPVEI